MKKCPAFPKPGPGRLLRTAQWAALTGGSLLVAITPKGTIAAIARIRPRVRYCARCGEPLSVLRAPERWWRCDRCGITTDDRGERVGRE